MNTSMFLWLGVTFLAGIATNKGLQVATRRLSLARWFTSAWNAVVIFGGPVVAYMLYASFAVAEHTLDHMNAVVFVALQMLVLLPVAAVFLWAARRELSRQVVQQGFIGGLLLGIGFIGVAETLHNVGIIRSTMLTGLDGIMASLVAWSVFRQQQPAATKLAGISAAIGALLLWIIAPGAWQADTIGLLVGLIFCVYALYIERWGLLHSEIKHVWAFFGALLASMAATTTVAALGFGDWQTLTTVTFSDIGVLIYTSVATVLIPVILLTLLQKHHSAVSLSFMAALEPLTGIGFAVAVGEAALALVGWLGVGFILLSIILQSFAAQQADPGAEKGGSRLRMPFSKRHDRRIGLSPRIVDTEPLNVARRGVPQSTEQTAVLLPL